MRYTWSSVVTIAALLALAGCGGSVHRSATTVATGKRTAAAITCVPNVRAAMAHFLGVESAAITESSAQGNNGFPQCSFANVSHHVQALANVDNGPSPYFVLERTAIETAQSFGPTQLTPPPQSIAHLGLEADWFPGQEQRLMATDGKLLITVTVTWPGARATRQEALAVTVARPYLHTPRGKAAIAEAEGYPSG